MKKHIIKDISRDIILFLDVNSYGYIVGINYCKDAEGITDFEPFMQYEKSLTDWVISRLNAEGLLFFDKDADLNERQIDVIVEGIADWFNHFDNPAFSGWHFETEVIGWIVPSKKPSI